MNFKLFSIVILQKHILLFFYPSIDLNYEKMSSFLDAWSCIVHHMQSQKDGNTTLNSDFITVYVQYSTVQYSAVQYSTVQYSAVQYSTVQYSTAQCSTVQYILE